MEGNKMDLKEVKVIINKIEIFSLAAGLLIGFALYGIFSADANGLHPLLNDRSIVYTMLIVGVVVEVVALKKLLPLFKLHKKLSGQ